jgi:hypothetical protein
VAVRVVVPSKAVYVSGGELPVRTTAPAVSASAIAIEVSLFIADLPRGYMGEKNKRGLAGIPPVMW